MSDSKKHTIDQLFKQKLEDFELTPQDASWKTLLMIQKRNLRMRKIFLTKVMLESVFLLSIVAILFFSNMNDNKSDHTPALYSMQELNDNNLETTHDLKNESYTPIQKKGNFYHQKSPNIITKNSATLTPITTQYNFDRKDAKSATFLEIETKQEKTLLISEATTSFKSSTEINKKTVYKGAEAFINSSYDVYAPVVNSNGSFMFFTSTKPVTDKEIRKGKGKERIYYTEANETGWSNMQLLENSINSVNNFNSAVALSKDGKSLFIYRDDRNGNGNLYVSYLKNYKWSTPEPLPYPINSMFNESSLSMTTDGNTLYFTSDRDGGSGEMDIWVTHKNKVGTWGEAKNLGGVINTNLDEEGVFIHPDGKTLFFSSRGHNGMGGFDIFSTTLENGEWTKPVNLGPEINTKNDDIYFVLEENGTDAYYTSIDLKNSEKKDILKTKYSLYSEVVETKDIKSLLTGTILEKGSEKPIKAKIEVYKKGGQTLVASQENDGQTGSFSISLEDEETYHFHIYTEGYLYYTEEITTSSVESKQVIDKSILLAPLERNAQFILKELIVNERAFNKELQTELDKLYQLMILNPELKIQLVLEANSAEESITNRNLLFLNKCTNYLASKGIKKERVDKQFSLNKQHEKPTNNSWLFVSISAI